MSENTHVTLDSIKELVENRHIAKLKSIFPVDDSRQIEYMMYYYDRKVWKHNTEPKVVFNDNEYVVVRAVRGYSEYHGRFYHSVWVIGHDETGFWMHRLPWNADFEEKDFVYTKSYIQKLMGFMETLTENTETIEKGKIFRLQGDLAITKRADLNEHLMKNEIDKSMTSHTEKVRRLIEKKISTEKDYSTINKKYLKLRKKLDTKKGRSEIRKLYNTKKRLLEELINDEEWKERKKYMDKRKGEIGTETVLANIRNFFRTDKRVVNKMIENIETRQVNLRLGNHLIVFSNAKSLGWSDVRTVLANGNETLVKDSSLLYVLHDEQQNNILRLDSGIYTFSMLQRHRNG